MCRNLARFLVVEAQRARFVSVKQLRLVRAAPPASDPNTHFLLDDVLQSEF
jgi:hypothetical protein